jgi:hypothetical protein
MRSGTVEPIQHAPDLEYGKMATRGFLCPTTEETEFLIKIPRTDVQEKKMHGFEFPGYLKVKTMIENTRQCFVETILPHVFVAKMAAQTFRSPAGDAHV